MYTNKHETLRVIQIYLDILRGKSTALDPCWNGDTLSGRAINGPSRYHAVSFNMDLLFYAYNLLRASNISPIPGVCGVLLDYHHFLVVTRFTKRIDSERAWHHVLTSCPPEKLCFM